MFDLKQKQKALTIVRIFETSRADGDYAACVVLNDGAGISFGAYQFTHASGSLAGVVERYIEMGAKVGTKALTAALGQMRDLSRRAIDELSRDSVVKRALRTAGATPQMHQAQDEVAGELYLRPAIDICRQRGWVTSMSLAVVYDSLVHGSWAKISQRVTATGGEKPWITDYVRKRHLWLTNTSRLRSTAYRTQFFLDQIAIGNWDLRLPLNVHGVRLTEKNFADNGNSTAAATTDTHTASLPPEQPQISATPDPPAQEPRPSLFEAAENVFERVDAAVAGVAVRTDRAKSLWATIGGTLWQTAWGVFGFVAGLPRAVWITVAVLAAAITLTFLYRQIALGKIREAAK